MSGIITSFFLALNNQRCYPILSLCLSKGKRMKKIILMGLCFGVSVNCWAEKPISNFNYVELSFAAAAVCFELSGVADSAIEMRKQGISKSELLSKIAGGNSVESAVDNNIERVINEIYSSDFKDDDYAKKIYKRCTSDKKITILEKIAGVPNNPGEKQRF